MAGLGDRDPDLTLRLHAHKGAVELLSVRPTEASEVTLERLRELAERGIPASRWAQLALAGVLAVRGEGCHEVTRLVERGWDDGRFLAEETCEALPVIMAVWALLLADELASAHALAEAMLIDAQARGSVLGFVVATGRRGLIALRRGTLAEAEADTRAALELATEHNLTLSVLMQAASLGLSLLERGELDQAAAVVEGVTLEPTIAGLTTGTALLETRGRVRLARGQRVQAITDLRYCGQLADQARWHNPNFLAWRSTLALALAPEHPHEARELAQTELKFAHRAGRPRAIGIALRVCALLTGEKDRIELLEQSVALLEPSPARLELAHSLIELGAAPRRRPQRCTRTIAPRPRPRPPLRRHTPR